MFFKNSFLKRFILVIAVSLALIALSSCQGEEVLYRVNFETNGGNDIASVEISSLDDLALPKTPTKQGYDFQGWYTDQALSDAFEDLELLDSEITLYASWTIKTYTVTFVYNNGADNTTASVDHGGLVDQPTDPTQQGMVFDGWYLDSAFVTSYDFSTPVTSPVSLYAKWSVYVPTDAEKLTADLDALVVPTQATADLTLLSRGALNQSRFSWSSSHEQFITRNGYVQLAGYGTGGQTVTLTVSGTLNNAKETRTFDVFVPEKAASQVTSLKTIPFVNISTEYLVADGNIKVFFTDGNLVPYVDIESFITLLDGAIESVASEPVEYTDDEGVVYNVLQYMEVEMKTSTVLLVRLVAEYYLGEVLDSTEEYEAEFDFENNTYYSDSFTFFEVLGAQTSTDFGQGLEFGETFETAGSDILINFNEYRFDLVQYSAGGEDYNLIPLNIANLLFVGGVYYDVYYNGDSLYGVDSYQFLDGVPEVITAKTSSSNTKESTEAERVATYDYLALVFDHFYGLKSENNVETYYDVFKAYAIPIMYGNDDQHYNAIFDLVYYLDDLHTYHTESGFYWDPYQGINLSINDLGPRSSSYYENSWALEDYIEEAYGKSGRPVLRVIDEGKTAIIVIDSFTVDTPDEFKAQLDIIVADYPLVENVVVDLIDNGGGNVGAVWRTLGYMTDEVILYHSQNPVDGATFTYEIFDTYPAYDYNWFILISPTTFSAANLMAAQAKELGIATVIGVKSSGGASSISGTVLPTGDVIFMSSTNVISTKNAEGEYISVEYGVVPDFDFGSLDKLVDEDYIASMVNQANQTE